MMGLVGAGMVVVAILLAMAAGRISVDPKSNDATALVCLILALILLAGAMTIVRGIA